MSRLAHATHRRQRWPQTVFSNKTIHTCQYGCVLAFRFGMNGSKDMLKRGGSLVRWTTGKTTARKWVTFNSEVLKRINWDPGPGAWMWAEKLQTYLWMFSDHLVEIQTHGWLCALWQKNYLPSNQHDNTTAPHISSFWAREIWYEQEEGH